MMNLMLLCVTGAQELHACSVCRKILSQILKIESVISIKSRNALYSHFSTSDVSLQHKLVHFVSVQFRSLASRSSFTAS